MYNNRDLLTIVQFSHPGNEHGPDTTSSSIKSWNDGPHRRKFLLSDGEYVENEIKQKGKLVFWGEWEPPSRVKSLKRPNDFYPQWLHEPFLPKLLPEPGAAAPCDGCKGDGDLLQNTDPFVFGDCFIYAICKQSKDRGRTQTQLANLKPGSVILFGSTHGKSTTTAFFQLDTVFVISSFREYGTTIKSDLVLDEAYRNISFRMAYPTTKSYPLKHRVYFGATFEKPCNGMYSFVPAKKWEGGNIGFPRIQLKDLPYITNNLNAAPRINGDHAFSNKEIYDFWLKIRDISRENGCVEGVQFVIPRA